MSLRINTNLAALSAHRQLKANDEMLNQSLGRMSSGLRVNGAADDAAGLAIGQKMISQVNGLDQSSRNAQDGISLLQTAEGALGTSESILQRMRTLAVQAANDTLTASDRANIASEMNQLSSEIDKIANATEFNNKKLLDGSNGASDPDNDNDAFSISNDGDGYGLIYQIGANAGQALGVSIASATASALSVNATNISVDSAANASSTITNIDNAINLVSSSRANLGAYMNRLQNTISNLSIQSENTASAKSRIMDLDMADEVIHMSKGQILSQSATAMLAQANQSSQGILSLLRG